MDIEDQIKVEHDSIKKIIMSLDSSTAEDAENRRQGLGELVKQLTSHEEAEEGTFYLALREDERLKDLAMEGVEQHNIIQILLENLDAIDAEGELWLPKLRAAKGVIDNHMLLEERLLLPVARDILGDEAMERLSRKYSAIISDLQVETGPVGF